MTTKKVPKTETKAKRDDGLRSEYRFNYSKAKPNRFAERTRPGSVAVLLDPDVAEVFRRPESVNAVLRALMATMPTIARPRPDGARSGARSSAGPSNAFIRRDAAQRRLGPSAAFPVSRKIR